MRIWRARAVALAFCIRKHSKQLRVCWWAAETLRSWRAGHLLATAHDLTSVGSAAVGIEPR